MILHANSAIFVLLDRKVKVQRVARAKRIDHVPSAKFTYGAKMEGEEEKMEGCRDDRDSDGDSSSSESESELQQQVEQLQENVCLENDHVI